MPFLNSVTGSNTPGWVRHGSAAANFGCCSHQHAMFLFDSGRGGVSERRFTPPSRVVKIDQQQFPAEFNNLETVLGAKFYGCDVPVPWSSLGAGLGGFQRTWVGGGALGGEGAWGGGRLEWGGDLVKRRLGSGIGGELVLGFL